MGVSIALAIVLVLGAALPASAVQSSVVIAACEAFDTTKAAGYSQSTLNALGTAAADAEVPDSLLDSISAGDEAAIDDFFTNGCLEPGNTTIAACGLYTVLSDGADNEPLLAQQLRFVLDNAASTIIADSLGVLADESSDDAERTSSLERLSTVFDAACENVSAPAPGASDDADPDDAEADPEPTATAEPEPTATAEPEATATPEPEATATPEPEATATPEPTATADDADDDDADDDDSDDAAASGSSSSTGSLPKTGADDVTFGLAKTAMILVAAGALFLAFEGRALLVRRRLHTAGALASPTGPKLPRSLLATIAPKNTERVITGRRTLADYD